MIIGVARVTLYLHAADSLKEKRRTVKSLLQRIHNRYNVSAAEVDDLDDHRVATLGITVVSNSGAHCSDVLATVTAFIDRNVELGAMGEIETELIPW
ncbi:MAG TPA: DUF503 domain-containing protein [Thermomicrobiales bacterium]|nr:DUF503 domain-containing protein [Thermomicrobiales bacterium]